jgi:hypothetical protein
VTGSGKVDVALLFRGHLGGVEDEQLFPVLIADPEFLFVRSERGPMSAVRDWSVASEDALRDFAGSKIEDIETNVFAQADVGGPLAAVDREGKNAGFANSIEMAHE